MTEDFTPYFADFGVDATVAAVAVRGIFDNDFLTTLGITAGSGPVLLLPTASVGSAVQGSAVVVAAISYTITALEPDGTGMTLLRLQEA